MRVQLPPEVVGRPSAGVTRQRRGAVVEVETTQELKEIVSKGGVDIDNVLAGEPIAAAAPRRAPKRSTASGRKRK